MKFSIGDRVLLKRTGEEGEIVAFIGKEMMEVVVNGIHFPVYSDEVEHPYLSWFTNRKKETSGPRPVKGIPVQEKKPPPKLARGIYLSYLPVFNEAVTDDIVERFRIFLLNETPVDIRYRYVVKAAAGPTLFEHTAILHPFGNIYLHSLSLEEMNDQPRFYWEVAEQKSTANQKGQLKIKPQKLFSHIQEGLATGQPTFSYLLTDDPTIPNVMADTKVPPSSLFIGSPTTSPKVNTTSFNEVLDLHADALLEDAKSLSPIEILQYQLSALEHHIELAVIHQAERVVIIHGVGTGALRLAVQEALSNNQSVKSFADNWEGSWGYGATIAYIK